MSKVNLNILEVNADDFKPSMEWELKLGSAPKYAGTKVESFVVPQGKVWLCPLGNDFAAIERVIKGIRIVKSVNI